jgi:predicted nucleotidyltransferase
MAKQYNTSEALARKADLEAELARILPIIIKHYQPEKIILFGSLATGEVHEWSDIDLALVKEVEEHFWMRPLAVKKILDSQLATDLFIYRPIEFERMRREGHYFMIDEILGKGKVLYERSGQMA